MSHQWTPEAKWLIDGRSYLDTMSTVEAQLQVADAVLLLADRLQRDMTELDETLMSINNRVQAVVDGLDNVEGAITILGNKADQIDRTIEDRVRDLSATVFETYRTIERKL